MAYIGNVCHVYGFSSANVCMNKAQWNTVILDDSIPQGELERMMDNLFVLAAHKMAKGHLSIKMTENVYKP